MTMESEERERERAQIRRERYRFLVMETWLSIDRDTRVASDALSRCKISKIEQWKGIIVVTRSLLNLHAIRDCLLQKIRLFSWSWEEFLRRNCKEHEKSFSDTLYGGCLLFIAGRKWFIFSFFFTFIGQRCNAKMFNADETWLQRRGNHKFHGWAVIALSKHHPHTRVRKSQCESSK